MEFVNAQYHTKHEVPPTWCKPMSAHQHQHGFSLHGSLCKARGQVPHLTVKPGKGKGVEETEARSHGNDWGKK